MQVVLQQYLCMAVRSVFFVLSTKTLNPSVMFRLFCFALCSLPFLTSYAQNRPTVVERPVFDVWNSKTLEIDKIVMTDSSTVFYIDAFYHPKQWIMIAHDTYIRETGADDKLTITSADGIPLGEHYYMPESGQVSFQLYFPPLPSEVTKIDFIESDCDGCFKIWGISLLPDTKLSLNEIKPEPGNSPLPSITFSNQAALIKGKMMGYEKYMDFSKVEIHPINMLTANRLPMEFSIGEDGSFNGEVNIGVPSLVSSRNFGYLFLTPGQQLEVNIDLKRKSRFESRYRTDKEPDDSLYVFLSDYGYSKTYGDLERSLSRELYDYNTFFTDLANTGPQEFKEYFVTLAESQLRGLEHQNYPENLQILLEQKIKVWLSAMLLQYEIFAAEAYYREKEIPYEKRAEHSFAPETPDISYYSFLQDWLTDQGAYSSELAYVVSRIRNIDHFNSKEEGISSKEQFEYLKERLSPFLGTDKPLIYDIIQAQFYADQLNQQNFLSAEDKREIKKDFNSSSIAEALIRENDNLLTLIESNKKASERGVVVNNVPDGIPAEQLLDSILSKYEGRVVLVDFWATWCGPCINAMKSMKPHKKEMIDKGVAFVYLTDESSPLGLWSKMIADTEGEHYRVGRAQWDFWREEYQIEGVPTILIFDKMGQQVSKFTGFPGIEAIQEKIAESGS